MDDWDDWDDLEDDDEEVAKPFVVCRLEHMLFAVPSDMVESMVRLDEVSPMPQMPSHVRGVLKLRGSVLQVVDTRVRLGLPSLPDEVRAFQAMMDERLADHERWLAQLRQCVEEHRPFDGQLDPTRCAFGKWYGAFKTNDAVLKLLMDRFDAPHRAIHGVATGVNELVKQERFDEARDMVQAAADQELSALVKLFAQAKVAYENGRREIAVVLATDDERFAAVVDQVVAVEPLEITEMGSAEAASFIREGIVKAVSMRDGQQLIMHLEPRAVLAA